MEGGGGIVGCLCFLKGLAQRKSNLSLIFMTGGSFTTLSKAWSEAWSVDWNIGVLSSLIITLIKGSGTLRKTSPGS